MERNTAQHFVLQLGSLISLYLSLSFFLVLVFSIINFIVPNATENYYSIDSISSSVRTGVAMVVVFFPTYIILTGIVNRLRRKEDGAAYLGLTRWLIYLSLLFGGGVLLGDLVTTIMMFLDGDVTLRFGLKAMTVLLVIVYVFYYYIQDARDVWLKNKRYSIIYGGVACVVVFATILYSLINIIAPAIAQEIKFDNKQIQDLRQIQSRIAVKLEADSALPNTLDKIYSNSVVPTAPSGRPAYTYFKTNNGFELCANFSRDSRKNTASSDDVSMNTPIQLIINSNDWQYKAGHYCFERIIK